MSSSEDVPVDSVERDAEKVEARIETIDANIPQKSGLRTYTESEDHEHEPPITFRQMMSLIAMAFLWTGSQLPIYIFGILFPLALTCAIVDAEVGAIPPYIYSDIGGVDRWIWFVLGNLFALAAVCPFVGSLSDLIGRRYVALSGSSLICLGMVVASTANTMNTFIAGMTIAGAGAGVGELTALAATSELAPTRKRGKYIAVLVFTLIPFCPSVLWGQLIAAHAGWRYCGALCGAWAGAGLILLAFFYFPPPRPNSRGMTRKQIISEIDFIGGFLSISGMLLFMSGLQWGGYQYKGPSAHVLTPLFIGFFLMVAFCFWELYGASHPMFPARLKQEPRVLFLTLFITFFSGANFFSLIIFWPTQAFNVYGHDPVGVGVRGIPVGFSILAGACICLWLLSVFNGHNRELMIMSSVLMTAGCGSMACATVDNLNKLWGVLVLAGLGIGGIVVPASIISTIICPDDLIGSVSALTLAVRVIGGSVGYTTYYNIFISKFVPNVQKYVGGVMMLKLNITNVTYITEAIELTGASLVEGLKEIPGIAGNETAFRMVERAGQIAYAESYKYVYLASIAFGVVSIIAACFLGNIEKYMDNHVAVIIH